MGIFDHILNLFSRKKKDNDMSEQTSISEQTIQPKRKHKFEIQIEEADYADNDPDCKHPIWRVVRSDPRLDGGRPNIVEIADKKEFMDLQRQYAICGQRIRIIREIEPFNDPKPSSGKAPDIPQNNKAIPVQPTSSTSTAIKPTLTEETAVSIPAQTVDIAIAAKPKPKIVTIGDIEIKYDGDKIYQKQWMKLSPSEASNFRVVNSTNNKIVNLNGKHIEAKRWILVEEKTSSQDDDAVDNLIEG